MILLATFFATGGQGEVPRTTVVQIRTTNYFGGSNPKLRTRKSCEKMGEIYKQSLSAEMPDGTTLTMSCIPDESLIEDD